MKTHFRSLILVILTTLTSSLFAQYASISQPFSFINRSNPAFTGIYQKSDVRLLYRDQWSKIPGGYSFTGLAFQTGFSPKIGLGINATQEKASGAFKNYQLDISAAYHTELSHEASLHFGLNIGFLQ